MRCIRLAGATAGGNNLNHDKMKRFVGISVLSALVVVLQLLAGMISVSGVAITLTLVPIVLGAAFYGPSAGGILGTVFGLVVYIGCANGSDIGGHMVFQANPFLCLLVCVGKGFLAGFGAGLVYRLISGKSGSVVRASAGVFLAAVTAPILNTGTFCLSMYFLFQETLQAWANGSDLINYVIFGLCGINFLVELGINLVLSPAILTTIKAIRKSGTV